jgi:hypothetical protein
VKVAVLVCILLLAASATASIADARLEREERLAELAQKSRTTIAWWEGRGRWARALGRKWCWSFVGERRERVCLRARRSHRAHRERLVRLERELEAMRQPYGPIGDLGAWLCIHAGEGSWSANTGNGYYGGLQMDYGFMRAYGGYWLRTLGTADQWPPQLQMAVAERARASGRGYYPWPNTARACGLI